MVNANFYRNDDVIVVKIVYNPNKKTQIIYNLIGELNEVVSHELRHQFQRDTGMFEFNDDDEVIVGNKEHYIFLMNMSYKLVKRFETSGYITTNTRILKSNADYIKQLLK